MKLFDITPIQISPTETIYKTTCKNNELISKLINEINDAGGSIEEIVQTYITPYDMLERYSGFQELDNLLKNIFAGFFFQYHKQIKNLTALHMWGVKHVIDGGQTTRHKHDDKSDWCGVFYLKVPKDSSPIRFDDSDWEYFPNVGDILFWESHIYHSVAPGKNTEDRITAVFNYKDNK